MAKDPVCGMNVDENKTEWTTVYKGKTVLLLLGDMQREFRKRA